ncbi:MULTISPECIES: YheU family protein [Pseudomonas]|uniref:YheU family protein n=1 Tax=Pseudomonas TaxID=286 RepID=UPI0002EF5461|nr:MULTISPECIES: YheU family protein [Pseudomonas]CEK42636.1 hypothetical protein PQBR44_0113 [Pseudomonas putida UWC1]
MIIPPGRLSPDTLQRLIEDFVSREGTDNGDDSTEAQKVARVRAELDAESAVIYYDAEFSQCILAARNQVPPEMIRAWKEEQQG